MLAPLRERAGAPTSVTVPTAGGLLWRPATLDDMAAIHATVRLVDRADHPQFTTPLESLRQDFSRSYANLERDSIIGLDEAGTVVAYALVLNTPGRDTLVRSILIGGVRPAERGRGIGREVVAWQEQRARQQLATSDSRLPGWIMAWENDGTPGVALHQHLGFGIARYFVELVRDLSEPIPPVTSVGGTTVGPYTDDMIGLSLEARNEVFRDHWSSQPQTLEEWADLVTAEVFRPDLSRVARDVSGAVVGFVLAVVIEDDWEGQGFSSAYIDLVGVTREWRGRGLATQLLNDVLHACAADGLERVVLDVDFENETGARGLYDRAGFNEAHRSIALTKVF